jgi:hypothetical protein
MSTYVDDLRQTAAAYLAHDSERAIARHLARVGQLNCGLTPQPIEELPQGAQERFRVLARIATRNTDPTRREKIAAIAVNEIEYWINGAYDGNPPSAADIAREAIARFCALELK